jgi:hypothetical protein
MNTKITTAVLAATLHIAGITDRIKARYRRAASGEQGFGVSEVLMIIGIIAVVGIIIVAVTGYVNGKIGEWK